MRLQAFLPTAADSPTEKDFLKQMGRARWQTNVNNHSSYRETSVDVGFDEAAYGALDCFNLFSNLKEFVTSNLRGIEWSAARAVKLE